MAYSYICICVGFFFVLMAAVDVFTGGFPIQYLFVPILGLSYMLAGILMQVGMNKVSHNIYELIIPTNYIKYSKINQLL